MVAVNRPWWEYLHHGHVHHTNDAKRKMGVCFIWRAIDLHITPAPSPPLHPPSPNPDLLRSLISVESGQEKSAVIRADNRRLALHNRKAASSVPGMLEPSPAGPLAKGTMKEKAGAF